MNGKLGQQRFWHSHDNGSRLKILVISHELTDTAQPLQVIFTSLGLILIQAYPDISLSTVNGSDIKQSRTVGYRWNSFAFASSNNNAKTFAD